MNRYAISRLFFLILLIYHGAQAQVSQAPAQSAFSIAPNNLSALQNSINLISGQVSFPMQLGSLPGRGGLDLSVGIQYNSAGTDKVMTATNEFGPTRVLGLGWSLDIPVVLADHKQTGTRHDDDLYYVEGGVSNQLICKNFSGSPRKYVTKMLSAWDISYFQAEEKWVMTRENGFKYTYEPVQWAVKWGNWIGNSAQTNNQSRMAYVWALTKIENLWGDQITFEYNLEEESVGTGGLMHTRAFYLSKMTDPIGQSVEFVYLSKDPVEYVDPYILSNAFPPGGLQQEPDGFQEKYETKFLDRVDFKSARNTTLFSFQFQYQALGTGEFTKRILTSMQKLFPGGEAQPPTQYSYFDSGEYLGFLKSVTNSLGGHIEYYYSKTEILSSNQQLIVAAPATGYSDPKMFTSGDYVVVFWRGPVIKVQVYDWDGQWNKEDLWDIPSVSVSDYNLMDVALADRHFVIRAYQSSINSHAIFGARRKTLPAGTTVAGSSGAWQKFNRQTTNTAPFWYGDVNVQNKVFAGEDFVCFVPRWESNFYTWTWKSEDWEFGQINVSDSQHEHFCTAGNNYVFIHNDAKGDQDVLHLYYLDGNKEWKESIVPQNLAFRTDGGDAHDSYWYGAQANVLGLTQFNPEYVYTWDENYQNFAKVDIIGEYPDEALVYLNDNGLVCVNPADGGSTGTAIRFDGDQWNKTTYKIYNFYYPIPLSFGDDYIMLPDYDSDSRLNTVSSAVLQYNANTNTWRSGLKGIGNVSDNAFMNDQYGNAGQAGIRLAVVNDRLVTINAQSGQVEEDLPLALGHYMVGTSVRVFSPNYIVFEYSTTKSGTAAGIYVIHLENFKVKGYEQLPGYTLGTFKANVGFSIIASKYTSSSISLLRIQNAKSSGTTKPIVASKLIWSDGNHVAQTNYSYSNGKVNPQGLPLFNVVKTTSGQDGSPSLAGSMEYYFYNGLEEENLAQAPAKNNVGKEFLLIGNLYMTVAKDNDNVIKSYTQNYFDVSSMPVSNVNNHLVGYKYAIQTTQVDQSVDGVTTSVVNTFDGETGLLKTKKQSNSNGATHSEETSVSYVYWWEKYDPTKSMNLLSPIIQTLTSNNKLVNGSVVNTYSTCSVVKWSHDETTNKYYPKYTYSWNHASDPNFSAWNDNQTPLGNWRLTSTVNAVDFSNGTILEMQSEEGIVSAWVYDETYTRPTSSAQYASQNQIAYTSFEDNSAGNWIFDNALVIHSEGFNGTSCFHSALTTNYLTKSLISGRYEISYWMKGTVSVIELDNGTIIQSLQEETQNGWTLVRGIIEFGTGSGVAKVKVPVNGSVDDLRIKPVGAEMGTAVYDSDGLTIVNTDNNLFQSRYKYDGQYRIVNIRNHRGEIVKQFTYHFKDQQ